jgi:hypothetical protein
VSRPFGPKVTLSGYLVNGWNNVVDNNNGKSFGYSAVWTPTSRITFINNGLLGPENTGDEHDWRFLSDNILTYAPNARWTFVLNYDYGQDKPGGTFVQWQGGAGYAHYVINPKSAATLRAEIFGDPNGFAASSAPAAAPAYLSGEVIAPPSGRQEIKEATLTYEYRFHARVVTRFEVREDWSTAAVFTQGSGIRKSQTQFLIGNVITF